MPPLFFSADHDWLRIEDDGLASIGITARGLAGLGKITAVTLPEAGRPVAKGEVCGHLAGDAAAADIRAPLSGTITGINETLADAPEALNAGPLTAWLFKMRLSDPTAFTELMDQAGYDAFLGKP
jgi:glycine cleavage system H protein